MKRVIALVSMLLCTIFITHSPCAFAADFDWSSYTDEEIQNTIAEMSEIIDQAQAELSRRNSKNKYSINGIEFTVECSKYVRKATFSQTDYVVVKCDWTNNSNKASSFHSNVVGHAYQNGNELNDSSIVNFDLDGIRDSEKILPGYSGTTYLAYEIKDESDVRVVISALWGSKDLDKSLVLDLKLADLETIEK